MSSPGKGYGGRRGLAVHHLVYLACERPAISCSAARLVADALVTAKDGCLCTYHMGERALGV